MWLHLKLLFITTKANYIMQYIIIKYESGQEKMSEIVLIKPSVEYAEKITEYRNEFITNYDFSSICGMNKIPGAEHILEFDRSIDWIANCRLCENTETNPYEECPASTQYMAVRRSDDRIVGMTHLRHELSNEELRKFDGNIGYSVRPSERRKGYAKELLKLCLEEAREYHLEKVLLCCVSTNEGSRKAILANGGEYECTNCGELSGLNVELYWILL
jgi:predicted acetyltransferase